MAVALATLPLKSLLVVDGDALFAADSGTALVTGVTATLPGLAGLVAGFAAGLAGAAAFLATSLVTGFATFLATGWLLLVILLFFATTFLTATFPVAAFFTATLAAEGFGLAAGAAFFGCGLETDFPVTGLATGFLAVAGLAATFATAFFATAFFATAFFATTFFVATFLAAALVAATLPVERLVFAGVLPALFKVSSFVAVAFDLPALASCLPAEAFPFCVLAAVELRVVFAISLHHFRPWRPGVIAHVSHTGKRASGILCTTTCCKPFRQREYPDPIDTVVAPFVQALAESTARTTLSLPSELL